jgi:hypothetical protein
MAMRRQTALKSSSTPVVTQPPAEPTRLFGVRLAEVMKRPSQTIIPTFVKQLIHYLTTQAITTEGLFRIAPNPKILTEMKAKIDSGKILFSFFSPLLLLLASHPIASICRRTTQS